jgi:hypothetical protein
MNKSYHLEKDNLGLTFRNYLKVPTCFYSSVAKRINVLTAMLIVFCFASTGTAFGQGVFTSAATGDWNAAGSWTLSSGSDADGIPDADDNVTIASANTITVDANSACNNITLNGAATGTRLAIGNFTLEVSGTLNGDGTNLSATLITSGTGRLKFIGNSRALFGASWGGNPPSWRFEVALTAGQTGTASTSVKAGDIIITSGTFDLGVNELRPDNNVANTGSLTIEDGAVLRCLRLSRTGTANTPFASMTMNGTAKLQLNSATASTLNYLPAVAGGFPVYTFGAASTIEYVGASSGTISVVPYQNLTVTLANASGSRSFAAANSIAGNLTITSATLSFASAININVGGNVTINGDAVLTSGSGTSTLTGSGASNALIVNNNGILTIVNRSTAASPPAAGTTTPFSTQYPGFETITLNTGSTVEYRVPGGTAMGTQDIQVTYGGSTINYQNLTVSLATTTLSQSATQYIPDGLSIAGRLRFTINSILATNIQDVVFNNTTALTVGSLDITRTGALSAAIQNVKFAGQTYNVTGATTLNNSGPQFQSNATILNFNGAVTTAGTLTNQGILRFNNFTPTINFNNNLTDGAAATTFSVSGTEVPVINFNNGTSGTPMTTTGATLRGAITVNGYRTATGNFRTSNATASAYSMNIAGTLDLGASTSVATNSGGGTNTINGSGTIKLTGAYATQVSGYSANNFQGTGTLHFAGSTSQAIPAGTYANVIVENAAGATLGGNTTVNSALTLTSGTLATGANTLTLKGATSGSGLIDTGLTGTLVYNGAAAQTVSNLTAGTANALTIDNAAGVTIGTNTIVNTNLTLNAGSLATLVSGRNLRVNNAVINNGTLTLENNANLIQVNDVANTGSGSTTVKRNSNPLFRLDYTLWSSPVSGAQTLVDFSPLTTVGRFYTYNPATDLYNITAPTTPFATGTGYLIRMPNTDPTTDYDAGTSTLAYPGVFTGTPNNGTVTLGSVTPLVSDKYYAVGNPYPSTISANDFINGNSTDGTLYFWRKKNQGTGSAYATYNLVGTTVTAAQSGNGSATPDGTIAVGQGFIVKTGATATTLTFTNAMRTANNSAQFFKTKQVAQKDRVWLNLTNTTGAFSQALVGYMDGATLGVDNGIDGKYINDSSIALTSSINNQEYTIQGRPAFDATDVVALNFKTDKAGDYTIAIDHVDGVFATGQDVYLVDSKTGAETNLKTSSYTFTAAAAVDNARFSLKYQKTLSMEGQEISDNSVIVYKNTGVIYVNSGAKMMNNIKVFDIQGRVVAEQKNLKANTTSIQNLRASNQVLIVKITTDDNQVISKKVEN